jgi:hypothetical protein
MNPTAAGEAPVDRPVRPGPEAHKLTDRQIADMAFAVLREHNDNRLWRALTYDSGPYDVTTPTLALCHLARVFFGAGVAVGAANKTMPDEWLVKVRRLVQGFEHVSGLARLWEPDYSSGSERALWARATEACADVAKLLD